MLVIYYNILVQTEEFSDIDPTYVELSCRWLSLNG